MEKKHQSLVIILALVTFLFVGLSDKDAEYVPYVVAVLVLLIWKLSDKEEISLEHQHLRDEAERKLKYSSYFQNDLYERSMV